MLDPNQRIEPHSETEPPKPLTFWEKCKVGVKGFCNMAVQALPRTLIFSGIAFAASYGLGQWVGPGFDLLTVTGNSADMILGRLVNSMALGSAISGVVGAYQCVSGASAAREDAVSAVQSARARSPETPHKHIGHGMSPGLHGLPPRSVDPKSLAQPGMR